MPKKIDISKYIGKHLGRLTILEEGERVRLRRVICKCDCGNIKEIRLSHIMNGLITSCGCKKGIFKIPILKKHGVYHKDILHLYIAMKARCYNPKNKEFNNYGVRGISVCKEWLLRFELFYDWCIKHGWKKGLILDRQNNNYGYSPQNCRFVTPKQSSRNTRINKIIEFNGDKKPLAEWCEILNLKYGRTLSRLRNGYKVVEAFNNNKLKTGKNYAKL